MALLRLWGLEDKISLRRNGERKEDGLGWIFVSVGFIYTLLS